MRRALAALPPISTPDSRACRPAVKTVSPRTNNADVEFCLEVATQGNAMNLENLSIGRNPPHEVNVVIEVPIGGEPIKYEMHKQAGMLVVDRFLYTAMRYPGNYGFIPHTLSEDGDPCDVLVANTRPIVPGAAIAVCPVGVLMMTDEAGGDEKIVAVPAPSLTQRYADVKNYTDLPEITWRQIEHFFAHYKELEPGKWVKFAGWGDADAAKKLIVEAIERAKSQSTK
jgi:inorganic pyrophosphatase